jgi:N-acetylneuraminic acid mutarotase
MRLAGVIRSAILVAIVATPSGLPALQVPASAVQAPAQQLTRRHEHGYVKLGSKFYLLGGRGIKPVDIFDPATGAWTKGAPTPVEMHHFQAVVFDNQIYVVGAMTGAYPKEPPLSHVYIYDPAANAWSQGPEVPVDRRRGGSGAVLYNGEIYLIAGITNGHYDGHVAWVDALNPRTGQWRRLPDAPRARDHFHAAIINDKIYAAAGRRSSAATNQTFQLTVPEVDVFDLKTQQWTTLPASSNIPTQRAGAGAAVVNGRLIVLGGESGQPLAHDTVEQFDPASGRWAAQKPLSMGRHATQAVVHDGRIYLASGSRTRGATEVDTQVVYTIAQ